MCEWGKCKTDYAYQVETRREVTVPIVPGRPVPPRTKLRVRTCGRHLRSVVQHLNDRQSYIGNTIVLDQQCGVLVKVKEGEDWR